MDRTFECGSGNLLSYCASSWERRTPPLLVSGGQGRAPGRGDEMADSPDEGGISEVETSCR